MNPRHQGQAVSVHCKDEDGFGGLLVSHNLRSVKFSHLIIDLQGVIVKNQDFARPMRERMIIMIVNQA